MTPIISSFESNSHLTMYRNSENHSWYRAIAQFSLKNSVTFGIKLLFILTPI